MGTAKLQQQINATPHKPGVYQFKNADGEILYIGKAKDLKKRTKSYLSKHTESPKVDQMVNEAREIEITVTQNEVEALLLEATLIRKHLPPYNIFLKDDKHYAFLRITKGDFPILEKTWRINHDGAKYYGPYISAGAVNDLLRVAKTFFPYKSCTVSRDDPCLIVRHGEQVGPLKGTKGKKAEYQRAVNEITQFLAGKNNQVIEKLQKQMARAATNRQYERAALLRDRITSIDRLQQKQDVITKGHDNIDVVNIAKQNGDAAACLMRVRNGRLTHSHRSQFVHAEDTPIEQLLANFLEHYYSQSQEFPKTIVVPAKPLRMDGVTKLSGASFAIPQRGKRRRLLALCKENAEDYLRSSRASHEKEHEHSVVLLQALQKHLKLKQLPRRIETYDISNIQGRHPVGSMIVFQDGKPKKSEYRKFTVRDQTTPDDFRAMHQVLTRRLKHSDWPTPNLIIVDGGKGQLSAALRAMDETKTLFPIVSLAKRIEEVFKPHNTEPIILPENSDSLFLIQRMRDEAHRFAIGFYRGKHRKATTLSALDSVPGVGPKTKQRLLKQFGSVPEIKRASDTELLRMIGPSILKALRRYL